MGRRFSSEKSTGVPWTTLCRWSWTASRVAAGVVETLMTSRLVVLSLRPKREKDSAICEDQWEAATVGGCVHCC